MTEWMTADGKTCATCPHAATDVYADSVMDWTHGHVTYLCKCCLLHKQIAMAEDWVAKLPGLKAELETTCQ